MRNVTLAFVVTHGGLDNMSDDLSPGSPSSLTPPEYKRYKSPWLIAAGIIAVVVLLIAGLFMVLRQPASKTVAAPAPTATAAPAPAPTVAPAPTPAPTVAPAPAPTVAPTHAPTVAPAPKVTPKATPAPKVTPAPQWHACSSTVLANASTTCDFALNVDMAFWAQESQGDTNSYVDAYSGATDRTYTMTCTWGSPVICSGGNNAVVKINHN